MNHEQEGYKSSFKQKRFLQVAFINIILSFPLASRRVLIVLIVCITWLALIMEIQRVVSTTESSGTKAEIQQSHLSFFYLNHGLRRVSVSKLSGIPNQLDKDQQDWVFPQLSSADRLHVTNSRLVRMSWLSHMCSPSCNWPKHTQHNDMLSNYKSWHNRCRQTSEKFSGQTPYCHIVSFWAFATFLKELEIKGREDTWDQNKIKCTTWAQELNMSGASRQCTEIAKDFVTVHVLLLYFIFHIYLNGKRC